MRITLSAVAVAFAASAALSGVAAAASGPVSVYPSAGSQYNRAQTQVTFRGVSPSAIGPVSVVGSSSGSHTGRIVADSDGQGASFVPDKPFTQGETVTVGTHLNVVGGSNGTFSFAVVHDWGLIPFGKLPLVASAANGLQHFRSRPDLQPAALTVTKNSAPASEGDIFVAPQNGPAQNGPMIFDPQGHLVWEMPYSVSQNTLVTDFRVQTLYGQPVLTWWQGNTNSGHGRGVGVIYDSSYQQIATVRGGNGLDEGLHEFLVTPQGDAYIVASSPIRLPGVNKPTVDSVVQEIDIKTGLVLFAWHALDHVPLSQSNFNSHSPGHIFDPYHANSIALTPSGNLLISMRNTSAVYEVDRNTGRVLWTLGGKQSSFKMGSGTSTWGQHNAIMQPDGTLTVFDDGAGPPRVHPYSRGIHERLDTTHMTATLLQQYNHSPALSANFEGSVQSLPDGNVFLGWGQQPYISEDNARGQQVFDAHFNVPTTTYRAYRFPWTGHAPGLPALAVNPNPDGSTALFGSWNGAADVSAWRILAGGSPGSLRPTGGARKSGFETSMVVHSAAPYFGLQALGSSGQVLASSPAIATPPHVTIYGHSGFVPASGFGGLTASCFTRHPCHIRTTISTGRTVIAQTGTEYVPQNGAGTLYFQLSPAGKSMLARSRNRRLPVQVTVRDSSGTSASDSITLIPFHTSGRGPRRSVHQSPTVRIASLTDFVNQNGVGGILAGCINATGCHVKTTVSAGRTTIASTGSEFLGADELGSLFFSLTPAGRAMLAHAAGNQLGARLQITDGHATATAQIALARFS